MKFRSKTGKILNGYVAFRGDFCCEYQCEDCPVGKKAQNGLCEKWVYKHPYEAASLMGYEVVEDENTTIPFVCQRLGVLPEQPFLVRGYPDRTYPALVYQNGQIRQYVPDGRKGYKLGGRAVCWLMEHPEAVEPRQGYTPGEVAFKHKEANMDKPRICEVLGVEPGESFYIKEFYPKHVEFWIMDDGTFSTRPSNVAGSTMALLRTLDHPDRIIRKPRWTEQEVKRAKAIKVLWPKAEKLYRGAATITIYTRSQLFVIDLHAELFPSLHSGETVTLDEIIGGADHAK